MRFSGSTLVFTLALGIAAAGALAPAGFGQTQPLVEYRGRWLPVTAMDGDFPLVLVEGMQRRVYDGEVQLAPADFYADGGLSIRAMEAALEETEETRETGDLLLKFVARFSAEREYEDVFVALEATPLSGDPVRAMRAVGRFSEGGEHQLALGFAVDGRLAAGGRLRPHFYTTAGDEIRATYRGQPAEIELEGLEGAAAEGRAAREPDRDRPRIDPQRAFSAKPLKAVYPNYPEELGGSGIAGSVKAVFSIDEEGRAFEILDYAADRAAFLPEARRAIVETVYQPARFEGEALVATVAQMFSFNEYVSFAEGLVMIPYPELADRGPALLYTPLPKSIRRGRARLTVTVDALGRATRPEMAGASEAAAAALREALPRWVFLSAVEEGFPAARRISLDVNFRSGRIARSEPGVSGRSDNAPR